MKNYKKILFYSKMTEKKHKIDNYHRNETNNELVSFIIRYKLMYIK